MDHQVDLQPDSVIELGARWLVQNRDGIDSGVIDTLRRRFGVTSLQAIEMVRTANALRAASYVGGHRDG